MSKSRLAPALEHELRGFALWMIGFDMRNNHHMLDVLMHVWEWHRGEEDDTVRRFHDAVLGRDWPAASQAMAILTRICDGVAAEQHPECLNQENETVCDACLERVIQLGVFTHLMAIRKRQLKDARETFEAVCAAHIEHVYSALVQQRKQGTWPSFLNSLQRPL